MFGVIRHELFLKHLEGYEHVEHPGRLKAILDRLENCPLTPRLEFITAEPADTEWLKLVHDGQYIESILGLEIDSAVVLDQGDTVATPATPEAAVYAAGAGVQAVRMVLDGKLERAFCAVRPPGHHAESDWAMGFCIFNNIAVAAAYLVEKAGLKRVAVIDWDIHHGNGTEHIFIEDERVFYVSLHQFPHYPGTGPESMTGTGKGTGFTLNVPVGAGASDEDCRKAFEGRIIPALDEFKPEFILISAGFDGHRDDPLSGTMLTTGMYGEMTRMIRECADRNCDGRIVSLLEGGYNLRALADSVEEHIGQLL